MTTDESQHASIDDALDAAIAADASTDVVPATEGDAAPLTPEVPEGAPTAPAFELPAYTARWNADARTALEKLGLSDEHRPLLQNVLKQYEESDKFLGQRNNELGELRKRFEPLWEVVAPYEKQYALQGMTLQQGVRQLFQGAEFLRQSPDQALPWLAQTYRPREPTKVLQALATAWNADLGAAAQDAPYIDPAYQQMVQPLQQELQQLRQWQQQQEQQGRTSQQTALIEELRSFEAETDDNGNPKHPYLNEVFNEMVAIANTPGAIKSKNAREAIAEAYAKACRLNDTISERIAADKAKAAEEQARKDAAARTAATNKTAQAAATVTGKGKPGKGKPVDLDDALDQAMAELAGKS